MFSRKKMLIILVSLLIFIAGITLTFNTRDLLEKSPDHIVIEDQSFTNIEVLTSNASVVVIPTSESIASVSYSGENKKKSKLIFTADVKGDILSVELKEKRRSIINFNFNFAPSKLQLVVNVPEKQYQMIRVENDNGNIDAENIRSKDILLETDNGRIELKNSNADAVKVKTANGRISIEDVTGKIIGMTDNGRITLLTKDLDRPIELTTDNGRIEIQAKKEPSNAKFDVKTDNGTVDIFGEKNKHQVFGKGKHLIKLTSDNGKITVTK